MKALIAWLRHRFMKCMQSLVDAILPVHGRRLVFMTRILLQADQGRFKTIDDLFSTEALHRITQNKNALQLPLMLYQWLWAHDDPIHPESIQDAQAFQRECEAILAATPKWQRYGRRSDMIADIRRVFEDVQKTPMAY